jgi:hypothetical protein
MSRSLFLRIGALIFSIALVAWGASRFWKGLDWTLSAHGWAALILGGLLTLGLSVGLFLLTFHSARHGYDEAAHPPEDDSSRPDA